MKKNKGNQPQEKADRGGFSGAVRTDEAEAFALFHGIAADLDGILGEGDDVIDIISI